jgi:hypothetical protein
MTLPSLPLLGLLNAIHTSTEETLKTKLLKVGSQSMKMYYSQTEFSILHLLASPFCALNHFYLHEIY